MKTAFIVVIALLIDAIIGLIILAISKKAFKKYLPRTWKRNLQWADLI